MSSDRKFRSSMAERFYFRFISLIVVGAIAFVTWTLFGQPSTPEELTERWPSMELVFGILMITTIVGAAGLWLYKKFYRLRPVRFTAGAKYEEAVVRVKPEFDSENVFQSLMIGGIFGFLAWGGSRFTFERLVSEISGSQERSFVSFPVICLGLFVVPTILFLGRASFLAVKKVVVNFTRRREWLKGSKTAEALIVDRQARYDVKRNRDRRGSGVYFKCELILKVRGQLFRTVVSERIFRRCVKRDRVNVFYAVGSPEVFIVEGE